MPSRQASAKSTDRCAYKSGKCANPRATKLNGEPHSLCAYHRQRQNAHQRKSDRKTRQAKKWLDAMAPEVDTAPAIDYYPPESFLYHVEDAAPRPVVYMTTQVATQGYRSPHHMEFRLPPIRYMLQARLAPTLGLVDESRSSNSISFVAKV